VGVNVSFLQNAKFRTKILSVLIPICAFGIAGVTIMANEYQRANETYSGFISNDASAATLNARAVTNFVFMGAQLTNASVLFDTDSKEYQTALGFYEDSRGEIKQRLQKVAAAVPAVATNVAEIIQAIDEIDQLDRRIIVLIKENRRDEAVPILKQRLALSDNLIPKFSITNTLLTKGVTEGTAKLTAETVRTIISILIALGVVFVAGIVAALFIVARGITGPIEKLQIRMLSLAAGETQQEVAGTERKDEIGQMAKAVAVFRDNALERNRLAQEAEANHSLSEKERLERDKQKEQDAAELEFATSNLAAGLAQLADGNVSYRIHDAFASHLEGPRRNFNTTAEKLDVALTRVTANASGIEAGSSEIRSAADDLARRTEQQAAAVEQTAAALEEITTAVKGSTKRAQEAGELVARTRFGAEQSGEVMQRAVVAMHAIEKSSEEIGNIIGVIDEIAFQTNLLALNAGVEAARAGDAGKGFAVVAQEVRELAQRSAKAAKEIKILIETSSQQVREGVQLVGDTGKALEDIVAEVQEISRHVNAIAEAAQEQSSGLHQINTAINQMDQDTQKNAAMVEETTAATHSLSNEVVSLNELLTLFRLSDSGSRGSTSNMARLAIAADKPAVSPARALRGRVVRAFSGNAAAKPDEWEEF